MPGGRPIDTPASCLLANADVRTLDARAPRADAIALRGGRIAAVGSLAEVRARAGACDVERDVGGATVLPGFIDAHQHPAIAALYGGGVALTGPQIQNVADLQRALATAARSLLPGAWLVASGWDEIALAERRAPTRAELDDAVPDRPLFALHSTCHRGLANSRALELAGLGRHSAEPTGGVISRGRDGLPDGLLIERGMSRVEALARQALAARDVEGFLARLGAHYRDLVAVGITGVVDAAVPLELCALYHEAQRRGLVAIPTLLMPTSTTGYLEPPWDVLDGPPTGTTDALLRIGPVKLVLDGAPDCALCLGWWQVSQVMLRTWALAVARRSLDPLRLALSARMQIGARIRSGIHLYPREEVNGLVQRAAERGFAVACHAEGNEAIDVAVSACEAAGSALHARGAPRIEHVLFADQALVRRIAGCGAAAVVQPGFVSLPAIEHAPSIPRLPAVALRWLLDAGVTLAGSSDFPVTGIDPLAGIRGAVTRRTRAGSAHEPEQALSIDEALAAYTRGSAAAAGWLSEAGTLEPSKRADVVVLSERLTSDSLDRIRVRATIVEGELAAGALP